MGRNGHGPKWSWAGMVMGRNDPESFNAWHTKYDSFRKGFFIIMTLMINHSELLASPNSTNQDSDL